MKILRVCVCDDDTQSLITYSSAVKGSFRTFGVESEVDTYNAVAHLRTRLEQLSYDIIFLDIDMPREDGISFARSLRKQGNFVPIVFVTAREDRMFDTFSVQPFGFVRKSRFIQDLNDTVRMFLAANPELTSEMLLFSTQAGEFQVNAKLITYVESCQHTQSIHISGQPTVTVRYSMDRIEAMLADKGFIRIHKGYIVNYRYIKVIGNTDIQLTTDETLPLSREKKKQVKSLWLEYGVKNGFSYLGGGTGSKVQ